jgi:hypothetical protein
VARVSNEGGRIRVMEGFLTTRSPWGRLVVVAVFAVAFAAVEAMVVYYLRKLFAIEYAAQFTEAHFHFPKEYLIDEQGREAATIVILVTIGLLAGRSWWQAFAYWLAAFGIWDIAYYGWLYVLLGWPSSLRTKDLLFLIPDEWWAPVWQPLTASALMIAVAVLLLKYTRRA